MSQEPKRTFADASADGLRDTFTASKGLWRLGICTRRDVWQTTHDKTADDTASNLFGNTTVEVEATAHDSPCTS